jgi:hypothetical protein
MTMWQCGIPLSKCSSLDHVHGWLPHKNGCDEGLPKERIINKRRTHQRCLLHTDPQHCLDILQPTSGCVFSMNSLLLVRTSCHIASWRIHCDNPFPDSCCFRNVGVHVTFDVNRLPPIHFSTKDTLRVSYWSLSCLEVPVV